MGNTALGLAFRLLRHGVLSIDSKGRIWRHKVAVPRAGRWRDITPRRAEHPVGKGYLALALWQDGKLHSVMAHLVVWEWLNGPIPAGMQVNHKDLNKQNNHPGNLELLTPAGNIQHSYAHGRTRPWSKATEWRGKAKVTPEVAARIRERRADGALYRELAVEFTLSVTHVQRICTEERRRENEV